MSTRSTKATKTTTSKKAGTSTTRQADAIAVLKADHRRVTDLFDKFEGLGDRADSTRQKTVAKIIEELSVHAGIEENAFYPAVRERFLVAQESMVLEALEEHHVVKVLARELESMDPKSERYVAKVTVLREIVDHHVDEEESELTAPLDAAADLTTRAGNAVRSAVS